ncbi:MAG TPA: arsenate reductase (glutaredoxin) [Gammaproteobacteria bacterium]|nr:arsenate reductase (glutaredoxin) [Gammaproteobacteria bacterium]
MTTDSPIILHNPRCTKSCQTLALLEARGLTPTVIEYLKNPPQIKELQTLLDSLGMSARQLLRKKEALYKELGLDDPKYNDRELLRIMIEHPILIERPIVSYRGKAIIGRPPETVLNLFD